MLRAFIVALLLLMPVAAYAAGSPDGTTSKAPSGAALVTSVGTWTWGAAASGRPGEYNINLAGKAAPGVGMIMEVANGGKLYTQTAGGSWYVWANGFIPSASPSASAGGPVPGVTSVTGAGTVSCSPPTGAVKCVGSAVPGPPGPTGPPGPGPISRDAPTPGTVCKDGDSAYMPDHSTTPPSAKLFFCDYPTLVWMAPMVLK